MTVGVPAQDINGQMNLAGTVRNGKVDALKGNLKGRSVTAYAVNWTSPR